MKISYPVFHSFDYERGKVLKPGKKGWWTSEGHAYVEINQAGFRDTEHAKKKPISTYRIAALGDSYTEARHVALQDTFPKILERYLEACHQLNDKQVEVLNFGVSGYGTAEELLTLRNSVWDYEPDLVLTTFFAGNDVLDNYPPAKPHWNGIAHRPYFFFDKNELKLNTSFRDWTIYYKIKALLFGVHTFRTMELVNQGLRVVDAWKVKRNHDQAFRETGLSEFVFAPPVTSIEREAWSVTEAVLTLMHGEVIEHGAKFLLVTATSPNQIFAEEREKVKRRLGVQALDYPERRLKGLGEKLGFPVLNLLYDLQKYADDHNIFSSRVPQYKIWSGTLE